MTETLGNVMCAEHQEWYRMSRDHAMYSFKSPQRKQALSETRALQLGSMCSAALPIV